MKKKFAGVDISSTAIKVAVVDGINADGQLHVVGAHVAPLKDGTVAAGEIKSIPAVAAAVTEALKAVGASRLPTVLGATHPDAEIYPREILAGIPAYRRLAAIATAPVKHATRIPASDAARGLFEYPEGFSDWDEDGKVLLSVAETRNSEISKLLEVATLAKINLHSIDLSAAGTLRAYTSAFGHSGDIGVLVDVGATTTRIMARRGPFLQSVETLTLGGNNVTRGIMATGMDAAAAEEFKCLARKAARHAPEVQATGYGSSDTASDDSNDASMSGADEAMLKAVGALSGQVASAIRSPRLPSEIDSIGLTGLGAATAGFAEALKKRSGVEHVSMWRPWIDVKPTKHSDWLFTAEGDSAGKISLVRLLAVTTAAGLAAGGHLR